MQISATSSASYQPVANTEPLSKTKRLFLQLGSALASGDVAAARQAFVELQKYVPSAAAFRNDPIGEKMATVGKALDSGDLKAAQAAYNDVKTMAAQAPAGGGKVQGVGGPPPGGGGKAASAGSSSSSTTKVYDPKDANKDGTVSWKEEQDYNLKHPEAVKADSESGKLDALA